MTYIFRGKVIGKDTWVYGSLIQREDSFGPLTYIEVQHKYPFERETFQVRAESVGLTTGRKDKKGAEIFAGDIVDKGNGEIFWDENACQFRVRWHETTFRRIRGSNPNYKNGEPLFANSEIVWEVIGNLTDNPELINP